MITFHVESFAKCLPEFKPLLPLHWQELALNQDQVPLDPQWEFYFDRERRGELLFVSIREKGSIIGYYIGFVAPALHYQSCLTCITDIFFVAPDKRGAMTSLKLFKFVEEELRRRGVKRWFVGSKAHADASAIFERLKFERVEVHYSKWMVD